MLAMLASLPLVFAASTSLTQGHQCAAEATLGRALYAQSALVVPPSVAKLMVAVIDGNLETADQELERIKRIYGPAQTKGWLNLGLLEAADADRAQMAEWLIEQGADVNSHSVRPAFSPRLVEELKKTVLGPLSGTPYDASGATDMWPPLQMAADCGNTATLEVLLAHNADMYVSLHEPVPTPSALLMAIIWKHEDTVEALLDHGYDPCLVYANYHPGPKRPTAVELATRHGFSASLIKRLVRLSSKCSSSTPGQSAAVH